MKLNPDCIRDILLTIEATTDFNHYWQYEIDQLNTYDYLKAYSHDQIVYHISQCEQSDLIEGVTFFDSGDMVSVADLTPEGHEFLANIRSNNIWSHVKKIGIQVGSTSLSSLMQIAAQVVSILIKTELGL